MERALSTWAACGEPRLVPGRGGPSGTRNSTSRIVDAAGGHVPGRMEELKKVYGSSARLLSTHEDGAVTIEISPDGRLMVESTLTR